MAEQFTVSRLSNLLKHGTVAKIATKTGPEISILMHDKEKADELFELLDTLGGLE